MWGRGGCSSAGAGAAREHRGGKGPGAQGSRLLTVLHDRGIKVLAQSGGDGQRVAAVGNVSQRAHQAKHACASACGGGPGAGALRSGMGVCTAPSRPAPPHTHTLTHRPMSSPPNDQTSNQSSTLTPGVRALERLHRLCQLLVALGLLVLRLGVAQLPLHPVQVAYGALTLRGRGGGGVNATLAASRGFRVPALPSPPPPPTPGRSCPAPSAARVGA